MSEACREVSPRLFSNSYALESKAFDQEPPFDLRPFRRIVVALSFGEDGSLRGGGSETISDEPESFIVEGSVTKGGKWEFSKVFSNQHRVVYKVNGGGCEEGRATPK